MRLVRRVLGVDDHAALRRALEALLVSMDRYRAYLVPGRGVDPEQAAVVDGAAVRARGAARAERPRRARRRRRVVVTREATCRRPGSTPGGSADEFRVRFQQTCGPVMAKGIEDTAFYRWFRLAGANEVGGHPEVPSIDVDDFHAWCARQQVASGPPR